MKVAGLLALGSLLSALGVLAVPIAEFDAKVAAGYRLIQTSDDKAPFWATEEEKLELLRKDVGYFDLTETYHVEEELKAKKVNAVVERATYPAIAQQTAVKALLPSLSTTNMNTYLSKLTAFNNRYYKATTGLDASNYIYDTLSSIAAGKSGVTVTKFSHSWAQQSIIAKIAGSSTTASTVVLGAHEDSINQSNPMSGRAPGADDDGTGAVNLIEVFRVLVASGFKPTKNVEFHWYSGEEGGLLGSNAIATNYKSAGKSIYAMLQLDMTGYVKPGTTGAITLVTDNTDAGLTSYVASLATTYSNIKTATTTCGYGCSDHSSWTRQGYPAAFPFESTYANHNSAIHGSGDTTSVSGFSWTHSLEFAKLALAFAKSINFFDLTETYHVEEELKTKKVKAIVERANYPAPSRQTAVNALLPSLSTTNMNSYLTKLTAFNNRYYKASTGLQASNYIYDTLSRFASGKSGVTITKFSHSWTQQSIIAKISGSSTSAPTVILGAHEDSINLSNPTSGRAPGADDDGTGTVNLIEIFRVLVASNFKPTRNIEFHFYSGEEAGLLGSQAIATSYKSSGKSVYAMLNLDMTGYFKPGTTAAITLITDNTDSGLNTFVRSFVTSYSRLPVATSTCGYGCSDHATWTRQGFPAAFPFEAALSNYNPNIHSTADTTSANGFSWSRSLEFAKVGLAFAYELRS
ncbi:unnamed protein product [Rhizoctonia solani]|uniref:Peptide hydrolase n=1 Tax=Rhizoctonia solani TaxID=456999 RepID=A0A8H2W860_9AGAM|nr:unnamed protein product [Rhizoctonia solani]